MSVTTTDPETIRLELVDQIKRIVPRERRQRDARWTWLEDQEIRGTLRGFDVVMEPQAEVLGGYGGALQYKSVTNIVVSYPVSEADHRRLVGADSEDLSALLALVHQFIPGMFPIGYDDTPIIERPTIAGASGGYTVTFTTTINFWSDDRVQQDVA